MRVAAVLVSLGLSVSLVGCTDGAGEGEEFVGTCPSWIKRMDSWSTDHFFFYNGTTFVSPHAQDGYRPAGATAPEENFTIGHGFMEFQDHPLDRITLTFSPKKYRSGVIVAKGMVEGVVTDFGGTGVYVSDHRKGVDQRQESIVFEDGTVGNFTIDAVLAEPDQEPSPRSIRIDWYFTPDSDANEDNPSFAVMEFTANFWYRTCGSE